LSCFSAFSLAQTTSPTASGGKSGIEGVISIAPAHPGPERPGMPSSAPLANVTFSVIGSTGAAGNFTTDGQGRFSVVLPAGHYTVATIGQRKIGHCGPFDVDVAAGRMTNVEWRCDSGMR
jgi:hypothetical protein